MSNREMKNWQIQEQKAKTGHSPARGPADMAGLKRHHDGKIAGLYDLDKTLGRGHFAVVKLARHVFTGEKVRILQPGPLDMGQKLIKFETFSLKKQKHSADGVREIV